MPLYDTPKHEKNPALAPFGGEGGAQRRVRGYGQEKPQRNAKGAYLCATHCPLKLDHGRCLPDGDFTV
jgi:hypothetical protein